MRSENRVPCEFAQCTLREAVSKSHFYIAEINNTFEITPTSNTLNMPRRCAVCLYLAFYSQRDKLNKEETTSNDESGSSHWRCVMVLICVTIY